MTRMGLWMIISALSCLTILSSTIAVEQTITARNAQVILDQVLAAQSQQPTNKLGWWI